MLEELLDDVVPKYVSHESNCIRAYLLEHCRFLVAVGCFELSLYESGTMLVTREFNNIAKDVLSHSD